MRSRLILGPVAAAALLALPGCGYVHLGKLPEPTTTVVGDDKLMQENTDLRLEKKMLQQELAISRAQGDALRSAVENRAADGDTSARLTEKLNETTRELATLRANYAQLQSERAAPAANITPEEVASLKTHLGDTENQLATALRNYTQLQQEITSLHTEIDQKRAENQTLTEQVKTVTAQNEQIQSALAQVNTELLAQKQSREQAEKDVSTLRTQLDDTRTQLSALQQQRTAQAGAARVIATGGSGTGVSPAPLPPAAGATAGTPAGETSGDARAQLDQLRKRVWALEAERAQLQQQLTGSDTAPSAASVAGDAKALADAQTKLTAALESAKTLRTENEQLKNNNAELTHRKTALESDLKARSTLTTQTMSEQLVQAQNQITALSSENAQLRARLSNSGGGVTAMFTSPNGTGGSQPAANGVRYHTVSSGDTLSKISQQYYGTPARWAEILVANREVLGEDNNLVIGRQIRIP